jgi:hypothetical protein
MCTGESSWIESDVRWTGLLSGGRRFSGVVESRRRAAGRWSNLHAYHSAPVSMDSARRQVLGTAGIGIAHDSDAAESGGPNGVFQSGGGRVRECCETWQRLAASGDSPRTPGKAESAIRPG